MAEKNKKYKLKVYNTLTRKTEEIEVSEEIYTTYCRTGWNIQDNDESFYSHEIQWSGLIGSEDGNFENFKEFIDTENIPDRTVLKKMQIEALQKAISVLSEADKTLIQALFYDGLTEREYSKKTGLPQKTINNRKLAIIRKLKKLPDFKK